MKKKKRMSDEKILAISQVLTLNKDVQALLAAKGVSEDDVMDLCEQAMEPDGFSRFMVRDKKTGLFSTGGWNPRMVPVGKIWDSLADVRSHFQMIERGDRYHPRMNIPANWEVVEFQVVEVGKTIPVVKVLKKAC